MKEIIDFYPTADETPDIQLPEDESGKPEEAVVSIETPKINSVLKLYMHDKGQPEHTFIGRI